ncbi:glycoside hydrolase family 26 protein [Actinocorallia libanotica]|uniref:Glycosyl hydrolase n=1 Tax=Actinocorallia libanotica TaxID=46162 RepID=A0ABN1RTU3_9ACTN
MRNTRTLRTAALLLAVALGLSACGDPALDRGGYKVAKEMEALTPVDPVDIRKLIWPEQDYLGLAYDDTITSGMERAQKFGEKVGKEHNLLKYFEEFGATFNTEENQTLWDEGFLPFVDVEPMEGTLREFADGHFDDEIRSYALQVKKANIPLAYSFGHEMNGWWYPWGYCSRKGHETNSGEEKTGENLGRACVGESKDNKPEDFVDAWRHLHDIFVDMGVGNVIWVWSPNTAKEDDIPPLKEFYPGDEYVDWIGVSGYMNEDKDPNSPIFKRDDKIVNRVFGDLFKELKTFTKKPIIVAETGSTATERKQWDIANLIKASAKRPDMLGFVWFNIEKEEFGKKTDFRIDARPDSLKMYRNIFNAPKWDSKFGFNPKQLINDD